MLPGSPGNTVAATPRTGSVASRPRPGRGIRRGVSALRAGAQVSEGGPGVGLAVRLSFGTSLHRPPFRSHPPPPRRRQGTATGIAAATREADVHKPATPHTLRHSCRDALAAVRIRHTHRSGTARPQRRVDDDGVHACTQSRRQGCAESARSGGFVKRVHVGPAPPPALRARQSRPYTHLLNRRGRGVRSPLDDGLDGSSVLRTATAMSVVPAENQETATGG